MQVLIPAAAHGPSPEAWPPAFEEVLGRPVIGFAIESCLAHLPGTRVVVVVDREHDRRFHLRSLLSSLAPGCSIALADGPTCGALCTAMLASDLLDPEQDLIVCLADVWIAGGVGDALESFEASGADAGVLTFPGTGPRWSYARVDDRGRVLETVEKQPISEFATAGVYWYRRAGHFLDDGEAAIRHGRSLEGRYYIAPALNESIAAGRVVRHWPIPRSRFHAMSSVEDLSRVAASMAGE